MKSAPSHSKALNAVYNKRMGDSTIESTMKKRSEDYIEHAGNFSFHQDVQQFPCKVIKDAIHRVTTGKGADTENSSMISIIWNLILFYRTLVFMLRVRLTLNVSGLTRSGRVLFPPIFSKVNSEYFSNKKNYTCDY